MEALVTNWRCVQVGEIKAYGSSAGQIFQIVIVR